ncbi:MAG: hypothetical protein V2A54_05995 [Bacteroidota bacterium]
MRRHIIFFVLFTLGLFSCSTYREKSKDTADVPFSEFLKKFKLLQLPLTFRQNQTIEKGLPEYNENSIDTLFVKNYGKQSVYYGMLPDTSNYFGLIFILAGVQNSPPVLKTYDKSGKQISEAFLHCGNCIAGLDIEWCSSTGIIKNDLTIYSVDTIKTIKHDNSLKAINGTEEYYMIYRNCKINPNGKTTVPAEQKKSLNH